MTDSLQIMIARQRLERAALVGHDITELTRAIAALRVAVRDSQCLAPDFSPDELDLARKLLAPAPSEQYFDCTVCGEFTEDHGADVQDIQPRGAVCDYCTQIAAPVLAQALIRRAGGK